MPKRVIFDKKNILITGGAGFIGSHICDELIKSAKVICLDNFSTGDEKNIDHLLAEPNFEFVRHDITESIELEKLPELQKFKIEFQGIQEIYHLACPMSPKDFVKNKMPVLLANSYGIKNALDLARKYEAKFLHFSSSVVYGPRRKKDSEKIGEEDLGRVDLLSARSSYDEGKRFAETMVKNYREVFKIDAKIIRLFRIYGPRMQLDDDQMLPDFVSNALDNKNLVIFGDASFSSALCYISDCVDAALKMMSSDLTGPVNIGSDVEVNLTDLAKKVIAMIGAKSRIIYSERKLFMTPLCLPDIAKARNELGWMPVISLEKGLEKTIYELRASKGLKRVEQTIKK
jgi:UDP-glucuronate decarboxylase